MLRTNAGYIYLFKAHGGELSLLYKLGRTTNIKKRMLQHSRHESCVVELLMVYHCEDYYVEEQEILKKYEMYREFNYPLCEWFHFPPSVLKELVILNEFPEYLTLYDNRMKHRSTPIEIDGVLYGN